MITEMRINEVFDIYIQAFSELAMKEDELNAMKDELSDYKEGGAKYMEFQAKIHEFEHSLFAYQRKLRLAGIEVDRVKTLAYINR